MNRYASRGSGMSSVSLSQVAPSCSATTPRSASSDSAPVRTSKAPRRPPTVRWISSARSTSCSVTWLRATSISPRRRSETDHAGCGSGFMARGAVLDSPDESAAAPAPVCGANRRSYDCRRRGVWAALGNSAAAGRCLPWPQATPQATVARRRYEMLASLDARTKRSVSSRARSRQVNSSSTSSSLMTRGGQRASTSPSARVTRPCSKARAMQWAPTPAEASKGLAVALSATSSTPPMRPTPRASPTRG